MQSAQAAVGRSRINGLAGYLGVDNAWALEFNCLWATMRFRGCPKGAGGSPQRRSLAEQVPGLSGSLGLFTPQKVKKVKLLKPVEFTIHGKDLVDKQKVPLLQTVKTIDPSGASDIQYLGQSTSRD